MEQYEKWSPIELLPKNFYLNTLRYQNGNLEIVFTDSNSIDGKQFSVLFKHCLAYRVVQESGRAKSMNNPTLGQFNKCTDSEFLFWFKEEGLGIYDDWDLVHYAIVNLDNIIDVISNKDPCAVWI